MVNNYINLWELILRVLRCWRSLIIVGICAAVFFGGAYALLNSMKNERLAENEDVLKMEKYESMKTMLESQISGWEQELQYDDYVLKESIIYNLDPYNVGRAQRYILINDIPAGENTSSISVTVDKTHNIAKAYYILLKDNTIYENIIKSLGLNVPVPFLQASVEIEVDNGLLKITVRNNDLKVATAIADALTNESKLLYGKVHDFYGEHKVEVINQSNSVIVEWQSQNQKFAFLEDYNAKLSSIMNNKVQLNALEKPLPSTFSKKAFIKASILGIVVAEAFYVFVLFFVVLFDNKIYSSADWNKRYNIDLLGSLPQKGDKRR